MKNERPKILLVITKSNFGGAQKYVLQLATELSARGYHVQVAAGGNGILFEKLRNLSIETIPLAHLGRDVSILDDVTSAIELYRLIRKERPDIVHLNSSKIGGLGSVVARLCGTKRVVFTIHGWAFNENRSFLSKLFIKSIYAITLIFSHVSIAVSEHVSRQAEELPFISLLRKKIRVIHNGIESIDFIEKNEARDQLSSQTQTNLSDKTIVGTIAELHPIKGHSLLLESAQKITANHPHVVFVWIGDGELMESLHAQITEKNLENKVILTGFIDNAPHLLKAFDVFCLPSKSEALGLVLLEAGLAELPIVASRTGGIPEILADGQSGFLFKNGEADRLTAALTEAILLSDEQRDAMVATLKNKVLNEFSISHMVDETERVYKNRTNP